MNEKERCWVGLTAMPLVDYLEHGADSVGGASIDRHRVTPSTGRKCNDAEINPGHRFRLCVDRGIQPGMLQLVVCRVVLPERLEPKLTAAARVARL